MDAASLHALTALAITCAPLVHPMTTVALVGVESGGNPYAIGVVGGRLTRQPRRIDEALEAARRLRTAGWNFSLGIAQINVHNLPRLGLSMEAAFDPCPNLQAMQTVIVDCFDRASRHHVRPQQATRQALSCYYSGNFVTGFRHGYVGRVVRAAGSMPGTSAQAP